MNKFILFNSNMKPLFFEDYVIISNNQNGKWLKVHKETYEILQLINDQVVKNVIDEDSLDHILDQFFEKREDYNYIKNIIELLKEINVCGTANSNRFIGFEITDMCNLSCKHCCFSCSNNSKKSLDLNDKEIIDVLDKIIEFNPNQVLISGGEPFMKKNILTYLEHLRDNFTGKIIIATNATLINKKLAKKLVSLVDQIDISIDGVDEKSCSLIRGKGVFKKVINTISTLHNFNFYNITLSMVFSEFNFHLIEKFYSLNDSLGTYPIPRIFSAVGRGEKNKSFFQNIDNDDFFVPNDYFKKNWNEFFVSNCSAGKNEFFIKNNADIYPCPNLSDRSFLLGNILIDKLSSIEFNLDSIDDVCAINNNNYFDSCKSCPVKEFCWTCPASKLEIKSTNTFDGLCSKVKPFLVNEIWR